MLTKTQLIIAASMLDMARDEFSSHGCNDYVLAATQENLEFVRGMIATSDYPEDKPHISKDGREIYVMDWMVMSYCRDLLLQQAKTIAE